MRPKLAHYFLTSECVFSCEHCERWQWDWFKKLEPSSLENIKNNLFILKETGVDTVHFTGGEPLLHREFPKIIKFAKTLDLKTIISSSGYYPHFDFSFFTDYIDKIFISFETDNRKDYHRIKGKDLFDQVVHNISRMKRNRPIFLNYVLTRSAINYLPEMVMFAQDQGVFLNITPAYGYSLQGFSPSSRKHIQHYFKHPNVLLNLAQLALVRKGGNHTTEPICQAHKAAYTVLPDGSFAFPCLLNRKTALRASSSEELINFYNRHNKAIQGGRDSICSGCLCWEYMLPSFQFKKDSLFWLNFYSKIRNQGKVRRVKLYDPY